MFSSQRNILNINAHSIPEEDKTQFPIFTLPESHGGYSLSPLGYFENHMRGMRYIVVPQVQKFPLYLRDCDPNDKSKPSERVLDNLLLYIMHYSGSFLTATNMRVQVNADIVCTSEVLELMMCAPYEQKSGWSLAVTRYRNTTYICRVASLQADDGLEEHHLRRAMQEARLKKLHKYCLSETGLVLPDGSLSCEEPDRFNGVFSINMNGRSVVFDSPVLAEICTNQFNGPAYTWAELKLRQDNMNRLEWSEHNRNEAIKWWCKCFLLNIKNLYLAYQNENAYVHSIKKTSVRDLWKNCMNDWSTGVCANFMVRLLGCINQIMTQIDCPSTVYLFEFDAKLGEVAYEVFEGRNEHTFLADWYRMMLDEQLEDLQEPMSRY